ncbi:MAG: orotate phosphoribosyltransferase [Geminicoccaceae bacterium]
MSAGPRELSSAEVVRLFRECGALLEGHFLLTSGMHSPYYLQCARVLMEPARAMRVGAALIAELRRELPDLSIDAVVAPALGGVVLGYEVARQLGVRSLFVERDGGRFALRRGFALAPGNRVLLAEDVVTTGLSSRECMECVMAEGAAVVAATCLIDRSGGRADLGVPLVALAELDLPVYPPDRLPLELAAQPAVKPGSRPPPT